MLFQVIQCDFHGSGIVSDHEFCRRVFCVRRLASIEVDAIRVSGGGPGEPWPRSDDGDFLGRELSTTGD